MRAETDPATMTLEVTICGWKQFPSRTEFEAVY
jgi:hypothetical protein